MNTTTKESKPEARWRDGWFVLPQEINLPVEVEFTDGHRETRRKLQGDWRNVKRWRELR